MVYPIVPTCTLCLVLAVRCEKPSISRLQECCCLCALSNCQHLHGSLLRLSIHEEPSRRRNAEYVAFQAISRYTYTTNTWGWFQYFGLSQCCNGGPRQRCDFSRSLRCEGAAASTPATRTKYLEHGAGRACRRLGTRPSARSHPKPADPPLFCSLSDG